MPQRVDIDVVGWSDGNNPDDLPRGYYALDADGQLDPSQRLRLVDDAPGTDAPDHHFETMPNEAGVGYYHGAHEGGPERPVPLAAEVRGEASFGEKVKQTINYILRGQK